MISLFIIFNSKFFYIQYFILVIVFENNFLLSTVKIKEKYRDNQILFDVFKNNFFHCFFLLFPFVLKINHVHKNIINFQINFCL